jgi:hypothetical protein
MLSIGDTAQHCKVRDRYHGKRLRKLFVFGIVWFRQFISGVFIVRTMRRWILASGHGWIDSSAQWYNDSVDITIVELGVHFRWNPSWRIHLVTNNATATCYSLLCYSIWNRTRARFTLDKRVSGGVGSYGCIDCPAIVQV